jgi:hypothetical protein
MMPLLIPLSGKAGANKPICMMPRYGDVLSSYGWATPLATERDCFAYR